MIPVCKQPRTVAVSSPLWQTWVLAVLVVLSGCSEKKPADVLAKVGTREIRVADLQQEAQRRRSLRRSVPEKSALLQEMIQQEALFQRAKSAGLNKDPQLVHEMENLLIGKLLDRELARQIEAVTITPEEVKADYESNGAKYTHPAKARLAILFLEAGAKSSETARSEARARLKEARVKYLENPETARRSSPVPGFGSMAVDYSDDQASRYRSGDIGWLDAGNVAYRWPKTVLEAGHALEKSQVSEVIEAETGLYLVMKTDAIPGSVTPLEKVEAELRQAVLLKKRRELDKAFRADAIRLAGVAVYTNTLQAVQVPSANPAMASNGETGPHPVPPRNAMPRTRDLNAAAQPNQKLNSL